MKRMLLPMLALVVGVALSAFTVRHRSEGKTTTEYYFFEVVNGQVDTSSPLNDEPMTIEDFNQVNPVNCPSGNNADCIRAWEDGHTPSTLGAGDYTIRKL